MLLRAGADINATSEDGATALIWAAGQGHEKTVTGLLRRGANIDAQDEYGTTALMEAVSVRSEEVVKELVRRGADLTIKTEDGNTANDLARKRRYDRIRALLERE